MTDIHPNPFNTGKDAQSNKNSILSYLFDSRPTSGFHSNKLEQMTNLSSWLKFNSLILENIGVVFMYEHLSVNNYHASSQQYKNMQFLDIEKYSKLRKLETTDHTDYLASLNTKEMWQQMLNSYNAYQINYGVKDYHSVSDAEIIQFGEDFYDILIYFGDDKLTMTVRISRKQEILDKVKGIDISLRCSNDIKLKLLEIEYWQVEYNLANRALKVITWNRNSKVFMKEYLTLTVKPYIIPTRYTPTISTGASHHTSMQIYRSTGNILDKQLKLRIALTKIFDLENDAIVFVRVENHPKLYFRVKNDDKNEYATIELVTFHSRFRQIVKRDILPIKFKLSNQHLANNQNNISVINPIYDELSGNLFFQICITNSDYVVTYCITNINSCNLKDKNGVYQNIKWLINDLDRNKYFSLITDVEDWIFKDSKFHLDRKFNIHSSVEKFFSKIEIKDDELRVYPNSIMYCSFNRSSLKVIENQFVLVNFKPNNIHPELPSQQREFLTSKGVIEKSDKIVTPQLNIELKYYPKLQKYLPNIDTLEINNKYIVEYKLDENIKKVSNIQLYNIPSESNFIGDSLVYKTKDYEVLLCQQILQERNNNTYLNQKMSVSLIVYKRRESRSPMFEKMLTSKMKIDKYYEMKTYHNSPIFEAELDKINSQTISNNTIEVRQLSKKKVKKDNGDFEFEDCKLIQVVICLNKQLMVANLDLNNLNDTQNCLTTELYSLASRQFSYSTAYDFQSNILGKQINLLQSYESYNFTSKIILLDENYLEISTMYYDKMVCIIKDYMIIEYKNETSQNKQKEWGILFLAQFMKPNFDTGVKYIYYDNQKKKFINSFTKEKVFLHEKNSFVKDVKFLDSKNGIIIKNHDNRNLLKSDQYTILNLDLNHCCKFLTMFNMSYYSSRPKLKKMKFTMSCENSNIENTYLFNTVSNSNSPVKSIEGNKAVLKFSNRSLKSYDSHITKYQIVFNMGDKENNKKQSRFKNTLGREFWILFSLFLLMFFFSSYQFFFMFSNFIHNRILQTEFKKYVRNYGIESEEYLETGVALGYHMARSHQFKSYFFDWYDLHILMTIFFFFSGLIVFEFCRNFFSVFSSTDKTRERSRLIWFMKYMILWRSFESYKDDDKLEWYWNKSNTNHI